MPDPGSPWGPMAVAGLSRDIHDALLIGTLRIDSCVFLEEQDRNRKWLLIWPQHSSAWDQGREIVVFVDSNGTHELRDSDRIRLGGDGDVAPEGAPWEWLLRETQWIKTPDRSCPADARWRVGEVTNSDTSLSRPSRE